MSACVSSCVAAVWFSSSRPPTPWYEPPAVSNKHRLTDQSIVSCESLFAPPPPSLSASLPSPSAHVRARCRWRRLHTDTNARPHHRCEGAHACNPSSLLCLLVDGTQTCQAQKSKRGSGRRSRGSGFTEGDVCMCVCRLSGTQTFDRGLPRSLIKSRPRSHFPNSTLSLSLNLALPQTRARTQP